MEILNVNETASFNFLTQSLKRKAKSHSVKFKALNFELWFYALRFTLFAILVSLCFLNCPAAQAAVGTNFDTNTGWIEQWGITWTFDKKLSTDGATGTYQYGTFVNGDYWIVGPVKIVSITPPYTIVDSPIDNGTTFYGRKTNGSVINPIPGDRQSYDSAASGWLDDFCVNSSITTTTPLIIDVSSIPIKSLVSTISLETVPARTTSKLKSAAILTIVKNIPSVDAFRPPYAGNEKPAEICKSHIIWNNLKSLGPVEGTPSLSTYEAKFERPWLVHKGPYPESDIYPTDNMTFENYGREQQRAIGASLLLLNLNYTQSQKERLVLRFLQYGIDVYGIATCKDSLVPTYGERSPQRIWYGAGSIGIGKKSAIVFAAKMFNHTGMIDVLSKSGSYLYKDTDNHGYPDPYGPGSQTSFPPGYVQFGEEQFFYVQKFHVDLTHNDAVGWPEWTPDSRNIEHIPYDTTDIGLPEWADRPTERPWTVDKWFGDNYRTSSTHTTIPCALAFLIMDAKDICNQTAMFDYCDRHMAILSTTPPSTAWLYGINGLDLSSNSRFVWNMWNTYRANYGPIWPDKSTVIYGDVSGDSALSAYDAALAARIAVGLDAYPTGDNLTKADVSGDGQVTAYDAALIAQRAVGLISKFPVES